MSSKYLGMWSVGVVKCTERTRLLLLDSRSTSCQAGGTEQLDISGDGRRKYPFIMAICVLHLLGRVAVAEFKGHRSLSGSTPLAKSPEASRDVHGRSTMETVPRYH